MKCQNCGGELKVTHSYQAGGSTKTQRGVCGHCGRAFTIVAVIQDEARFGNGAFALAKRIKQSGTKPKVVLPLEKPETKEEQDD